MALIKIEPYIIDTTGDFTFNNVTATGNLSSLNANLGNLAIANFFSGSGNNLSNIAGSNVSGQVGNSLLSGTVYTNAQPNITSVGTLTGLTSTGTLNLTGASNVALGPVANVHITGGSNGQYLQTDGSGILTWSTVASGSSSNISNGNSNVNIPSSNGNINLTSVGNTIMVITGTGVNIAGTLNATGNASLGNLVTSGSGGNIANANVISANTFIASGNITAGNISTSGSGGTLSNINVVSANTFTASGNITSGNANLGNSVVANFFTGNGVYLTGITTTGISNGNSNVNIPSSNGNINLTAVGNTTLVVTGTGVNVAGTANITGNLTAGNINAGSGTGGNIIGANLVSANFFTGTLTTNAQPNITSVGTLTSLSVTGNISAGNANLGNASSANYFIGNFYGTANSATTAGTVTTNAQPNITSVGTLTTLSVTGNGAFGNVNAGNLLTANYSTAVITTAAQPNITSVGSLTGLTVSNATGVVNFTTTANVTLGAVANLHISGGTANYVLSTDGSGTLSWVAQSGGGGGGASISNGNSNVNIPSSNGNINFSAVGNTTLVVTGTGVNVAGYTTITGNLTAGNINAGSGTGGNIIGANLVSANFFTGALTTNAQPNITSVGSLTGLTVSNATGVVNFTTTANVTLGAVGNLHISGGTANYVLSTDGAGTLNWVAQSGGGSTSNISNGNSNVNIPAANGNVNISAVGNANVVVITGTGANISGTANVTGNLVAGNITAGAGSGGSITGGNLVSANYFTGTLTTNAQPNITSVGSLTGLTVSNATGVVNFTTTANVTLGAVGNLHISGGTANYVLSTDGSGTLSWVAQSGGGGGASISNGNSNVNIPAANGNINFSAVGNTVMVVTGTGVNVAGYTTITGNLTAGNINAGSGTGGNIIGANLVSANYFTGTLTTNAQPNITSVGSLTGLTVSNATGVVNFTTTANVTLGAVGNLHISGGTANYVLSTDGAGTLNWVAQSGGGASISNGNSNVNIPAANGNINFSAVGNANVVVITGTGANIAGTANITGNLVAGNITAGAGSGGNITGGNVISTNTFIALTSANFVAASNVNLGAVGNIKITGGTSNYVLSTDGTGNLSWVAQSGGSSSNISNGNSNVNIPSANGNVNISAVGNANVVVITGTGANITGTANVTGNLVAGNITAGAGSGGSITGGNLVSANYFTGTLTTNAQPNITSVGTLTTLSVTGNITSGNANLGNAALANYFIGNFYGTANSATTAGTVTTAAQPNITSVGSLTGLTVSNVTGIVDFTTTANVTLGAVGNLHISGGTNGYVLSTDGSGTLSWVAQSGGGGGASISNGNSNVNIPAANGNINFSAVGNANVVVITGTGANINGTLNVTGQSNLGAVGNVKITGGSNTYVLSTDGAGNLSWTAPPAGANVTVDNFTGNGVQTVFTLSTTPIGINQTSVNYNGATVLRTDYTLANANITFSSAPANGSYIEVTTINLTAGGGGGTSAAAAVGYSLIFGG